MNKKILYAILAILLVTGYFPHSYGKYAYLQIAPAGWVPSEQKFCSIIRPCPTEFIKDNTLNYLQSIYWVTQKMHHVREPRKCFNADLKEKTTREVECVIGFWK